MTGALPRWSDRTGGPRSTSVAVSEGLGDGTPGDLLALVEDLVGRVEALHADVARLKSDRSASASAGTQVPAYQADPSERGRTGRSRRLVRVGREPRRSATPQPAIGSGRAGGVTVSSSRNWPHCVVAWLAVYDASEPVDPTAGVRWHDEADKCRERIRRTISGSRMFCCLAQAGRTRHR